MFEGQPKGLYALALANTGERFGYYTMLAIFTLFLQAKFGFTAAETSTIFGSFLAAVYFMPLIGGILADKFGYGKMVTTGIAVMFIGYVLLSIPTPSSTGKILMFGALALIACGTGLFKGNLQVMVGNLYDAPEYKAKRDTAFSIFYMAINIGAMYAPTAATMITNKMLGKAGFTYVSQIPSLAHQFLNGTITEEGATTLSGLQAAQNFVGDTATFCTTYIDKLSEAYNYGFAIACISLVVSMLIYVVFRPTFKHADYNSKQAKPANVQEEELTPEQTKARIQALLLVFAVVIFFWMAFHQNGLTLTFFARDYTAQSITGLDRLGFNIVNLTFLLVIVYAAFSLFQSKTGKAKGISAVVLLVMLGLLGWNYASMDPTVEIKIHDLPEQCLVAKKNIQQHGLSSQISTVALDVLKIKSFPYSDADVWLMSQFLDCFHKDEITSILKKVRMNLAPNSRLLILEPFIGNQPFEIGDLCLAAMSLYFTAIANGTSRFYQVSEFEKCIEDAGLVIEEEVGPLGTGHTLLICRTK